MIITQKTTQLGSYIQQDGMFFYQTSGSSSQQMFMDFCLKEDGVLHSCQHVPVPTFWEVLGLSN